MRIKNSTKLLLAIILSEFINYILCETMLKQKERSQGGSLQTVARFQWVLLS